MDQSKDNTGGYYGTGEAPDEKRETAAPRGRLVVESDADARDECCRNFGVGCGAEAGIDCSEERLLCGKCSAAGHAGSKMFALRRRDFTARGGVR